MIDRTYDLDEVVEATRYVETGQKTGNVVLRVGDAPHFDSRRRDARGRRSGIGPSIRPRQPAWAGR